MVTFVGLQKLFSDVGNAFKNIFSGNFGSSMPQTSDQNPLFGEYGLLSNPAGAWDKFKNGNTNEIAAQNLQFQKDNLDYQKALQQKIFEREDSSYARTMKDMYAAGLNPLSMNGTNGAGEVVNTEALHDSSNDTSNLSALSTIFSALQQAINTGSNSSLQSANANLLNAQADNQRIKNIYESDILKQSLKGALYDNWSKSFNNYKEHINYSFNQAMGWTDNMPDWYKTSALLAGKKGFSYDFAPNNVFYSDKYVGSKNNGSIDLNAAAEDFRKNQLINMLYSVPQMLLNFIK